MTDQETRDIFAAHALTGVIGRRWADDEGNVPDDVFDQWAAAAFRAADAMMRARIPPAQPPETVPARR